MRLKTLRKLGERGDTIVEVIIVIAVVSLILAGGFVTTNHSLQSTRDAQERGSSLKLAESQMEQIKDLAETNPDLLFGAGAPTPFCISDMGAVVAASSAECAMDTVGSPTSTEPIFHVSITRSINLFTVDNTWTSPRGDANSLKLEYRLYE